MDIVCTISFWGSKSGKKAKRPEKRNRARKQAEEKINDKPEGTEISFIHSFHIQNSLRESIYGIYTVVHICTYAQRHRLAGMLHNMFKL